MTERRCYKCLNFKDIDEFERDEDRKDGHGYICLPCKRSRMRQYRGKKNPPELANHCLTCKCIKDVSLNTIY